MRKSLIAVLGLLLCFHFSTRAQDAQQQIQSIRKDVYTRVLSLTDEEAAKFWPVFDEMQAKLNIIRREAKTERLNIIKNYNTMSDQDMDKALDHLLTLEQEELTLKKTYYDKFKKVLPIKKVVLIPKADREFKKELLVILKGLKEEEGN